MKYPVEQGQRRWNVVMAQAYSTLVRPRLVRFIDPVLAFLDPGIGTRNNYLFK